MLSMTDTRTSARGTVAAAMAVSNPVPARSRTVLHAVTGGLVTAASFPNRSWWTAAVVGVALLVLALRRDGARWAGLIGTVWGLAFFLPHLWWARVAAGTLPWLALATLQAVLVGSGTAIWAVARRAPWLRPTPTATLAFALTWVTAEQLRSSWPFGGFPWGRLAFSQTDGPLLSLAWLGGAPLVSGVVAAAGFLCARTWSALRIANYARAAWAALALAALVLIPMTIPLDSRPQSGVLRVAAVQGDVPHGDAFVPDRSRAVLDNHVAGTLGLLQDARPGAYDLVLWPENATDIDPRADALAANAIDAASTAIDAPILLGADHRTPTGRLIQMLLWEDGRGVVSVYSKQRVVPFGEYVPARSLMRLLSQEVDRVGNDAVPGGSSAVISVRVPRIDRIVPLATPICFEVAFDDVVRSAVRDGAELLVVPTNNASFGRTAESTQQLAMTRLRAVEHGRAAVQVSTVGVSAVIDPDGTIQQRTDLFTADTLSAVLPLRSSLTPADQVRAAPVTGAMVLTVASFLSGLRSYRASRRSLPWRGAARRAVSP